MHYNGDMKVMNGIYLFVSGKVKASRYINTVFKLSQHRHMLPAETVRIEQCETDEFNLMFVQMYIM